MTLTSLRSLRCIAGVAALASLTSSAYAQQKYLVIGDSYDFGYTTQAGTPFNSGLQGYVPLFAARVDAYNGGAPAPEIINLARPGEGFDTYATTPSNPGTVENYNQNYAPLFNATQAEAVASTFAALGAAPDYISVHLGGNDFLRLFISPEFIGGDEATRISLAQQKVTEVGQAMTGLMLGLRAAAPTSTLLLLSYPDPFAGLDGVDPTNPFFPVSPFGPLTAILSQSIRDIYAQIAALPDVNAKFVNLYDPFLGKEKTHTLVLSNDRGLPNIHLNDQGNQLVAAQMEAAAFNAPEPATACLLGVGILFLARRRKQTNPS